MAKNQVVYKFVRKMGPMKGKSSIVGPQAKLALHAKKATAKAIKTAHTRLKRAYHTEQIRKRGAPSAWRGGKKVR